MAIVHRFTMPDAVSAGEDIFVAGVGYFARGVLDIPVGATAAITAAQVYLANGQGVDLGEVDNVIVPPPGQSSGYTYLASISDASATNKGAVQLTGDLGGIAAAPLVKKINGQIPATVATSGSYADLANKPATMTPSTHAATHAAGGTDPISAASIGADVRAALAGNPDLLVSGNITRDANGTAISANVTWPDGTAGTYLADTVSTAFPGAVDGYHITYAGVTMKTYTQPTVTRSSTGAVTLRPAVIVS